MTDPPSDSDRAYASRLAAFIVDHIGKPYTAADCGHVLELRPEARSDVQHLLDVFIEGGWAEEEDIPVLDRLHAYLTGGDPYAD